MSPSPFMSLTNLIQYATTPSASKRRQIIEQYQNPQIYRFDWHGAADTVFSERVCDPLGAESLIESERIRVKQQLSGDKKKDVRLLHILELLELLETSDLLRIPGSASALSANNFPKDMKIGKLTVRVRPNLLISRRREGRKFQEFGIVKCHNLSSCILTTEMAKMYATAINMYAEKSLYQLDIHPSLCKVYDLYTDNIYAASKNQIRLRSRLYDAAQEISDRWASVGTRLIDKKLSVKKRAS